jgi:hypothetical protein
LVASATWGALIRVHRRHGGKERVLTPSEIVCWGARINAILPELRKQRVHENEETKHGPPVKAGSPLYVMWGTDWKDAPLLNAAALANAVPAAARLDWAAEQKKKARAKKNGVAGLFARRAQMANGEESGRGGFGLESRRSETVTRTDDERARDVEEGAVFANGKAREQKANEDAAPATTKKKRFLGEETRSPFPGGAGDDSSRLGSGCAPVAKRAKNSAIARMFAKCASPDGKR